MLPIGDDRYRGGPAPLVTVGLLAFNLLAFFVELSQPGPAALRSLVEAWGVVPREYVAGRDLPPSIPGPFWITLLTSMFLHAGWAHLLGNMLYLWIFGDNIEKRLGHARFLVFYLLCGVAAAAAHVAANSRSGVPTIGASGAISGVLGAYLILFPRNRVRLLTASGVVQVPAFLMLGLWVLIQLANGLGSLVDTTEGGGVAYMAHIGGFVAGILLIPILTPRPHRPAWV